MGTVGMIVIDTHIWVWWVLDDERLRPFHRKLILDAEHSGIGVADISLFEVAMLIERNRFAVEGSLQDWLAGATSYPGIQITPITPEIASIAVQLPQIPKDPFDRLILATAKASGATLLTEDGIMHRYSPDIAVV